MNASTASRRLWCLLLRRAAVEHDGISVRCIARTFRRPFRSVSDHSIAGGRRRVFGHSRRWHDHRPTVEMISIADVEYTIWSNGSLVRVQRTVVEPVVALPHIALSLGPIVTRSGNAYVPSGRPNPISAHVETVPGTARQIRVRIAFKCYKKFAQRRSPRPKVHSTHQTNGGPGRESSHREATFLVREKPV